MLQNQRSLHLDVLSFHDAEYQICFSINKLSTAAWVFMSSSEFQQALADLNPDTLRVIEPALEAWSKDAKLGQVRQNLADETALPAADFTSLLNSFATQIADGETPVAAWQTACRAHKFKGRQIPTADCPVILGRVRTLDDHAGAIAKASGRLLTRKEAKNQLLKNSGSPHPIGLYPFLRDALLGNYLVWAVFDATDTKASPFERLPQTRAGICTALGLGHITADDTVIVLVWNHVDAGSPPLHRPTVADAEDYPHYRPRPEADAPWGLTRPLPPNPDKLQPQPEVVMPETTSKGLRLPFRVI